MLTCPQLLEIVRITILEDGNTNCGYRHILLPHIRRVIHSFHYRFEIQIHKQFSPPTISSSTKRTSTKKQLIEGLVRAGEKEFHLIVYVNAVFYTDMRSWFVRSLSRSLSNYLVEVKFKTKQKRQRKLYNTTIYAKPKF